MKTLLSAATASRRSGSVAYGSQGGGGDICITIRGTIGTATATVDVSHDGTNWVSTGETLDTSNRTTIVTLLPGMLVSVNYTADGASPQSSWTVEAS